MSDLKKVICYGASGMGRIAASELPERGFEIICFCDSDKSKWGSKFVGYDVLSPEELVKLYPCENVVITSMYIQEITEFLNSLGITNSTPFRFRSGCYRDYILKTESKFKDKDIIFLGENTLSSACAYLYGNTGKQIFEKNANDLSKYSRQTPVFICLPNYPDPLCELLGMGFSGVVNGLFYLFYKKMYGVFGDFIDDILFSDKSYSNQGEFGNDDLILSAIFRAIGIPLPKYADIGCNMPIEGSNTYMFYENGARGQLVEPNPRLSECLRQTRPGDKLYPVGIGCEKEDKATFFINTEISGLSTFNPGNSAFWENRLNKEMYEKAEIDLVKFNDIIERDVQLVSIDAEGLDFDILKTVNFSLFKDLSVICAETFGADEYMREQGFRLFLKNYTNSIFVREDLFDKILKDRLCSEIYYGYACLALMKETCF